MFVHGKKVQVWFRTKAEYMAAKDRYNKAKAPLKRVRRTAHGA